MLRNKYRAFEIRDDQVSQMLVDGNLCSIAEFIRHCDEGSIITLHTMEGEPFLIGLSKMSCQKAFLRPRYRLCLKRTDFRPLFQRNLSRIDSYGSL